MPKKKSSPVHVYSSPVKHRRPDKFLFENSQSLLESPTQPVSHHAHNVITCACGGKRKRSPPPMNTRGAMIRDRAQKLALGMNKLPESHLPHCVSTSKCNGDIQYDKIFSSETDLTSHVKELYEKGVLCELTLLDVVTKISNACQHFYLTQCHESPANASSQLLRDHLLIQPRALSLKYNNYMGPLERKLTEYKLQVFLHTEVQNLLELCEESANMNSSQISTLLRTISFMTDVEYTTTFLNDCILERYKSCIPDVLRQIYDDLLQPLPRCLTDPCSPDLCSPVKQCSPMAKMSRRTISPEKTKQSRPLKRTFSIDLQRTFQISIHKSKDSKQSNLKGEKKGEASKLKSFSRSPKQKKNVKNISSGNHTPKKALGTPKKQSLSTPEKQTGKKIREVMETPAAKQKSNRVWHRLDRSRRRSQINSAAEVVEESPPKQPLSAINHLLSPLRQSTSVTIKSSLRSPVPKLSGYTTVDNVSSSRRITFSGIFSNEDNSLLTHDDLNIVFNSPTRCASERDEGNTRRSTCSGLVDKILKSPRQKKSGMAKKRSFYSSAPEMASRNVQRYEKLEKRLTQKCLLSPVTVSRLSQPSRRIQTTNFFNISASPLSPRQKLLTPKKGVIVSTPKKACVTTPKRNCVTTPKGLSDASNSTLQHINNIDLVMLKHCASNVRVSLQKSIESATKSNQPETFSAKASLLFTSPEKSNSRSSPATLLMSHSPCSPQQKSLVNSPRCSPRQNLLNRYSTARVGPLPMS